MAEDFRAIIRVELNSGDLSRIQNQIKNLQVKPIEIKINTSSIQSQINNISKQLRNIKGATIPLKVSTPTTSATPNNSENIKVQISEYQKLQEIINKISNTRLRVENLKIQGGSQQQIGALIADLQNLGREYNSLKSQMSGQLTTAQTSNLNNSINNIIQKVNELKTKTKDSIILKIDNGTLSGQISALENKFNKLKEKPTEVADRITALKTALQQIDRNASADKIISEYNQLKQQIKDTTSAVTELNQQQQLSQRKTTLNSNIDAWLKRNSSASSVLVTQIRNIQSQIAQADSAKLTQLTSQFKNVTNQALVMGQTGLSVMDRLKKQFSTLGVYFSASMLIMRTTRALRDMYNVVVKVDDALTELKKVSGASDSQLNISFENSKKNAKDYAMSLSDMINATADWSRTGYSLSESETLAKVSALYKNVGDNIDIDTANESLISTLQGFQLDTEEAESIIDKFNEVNKAASYYSNIIASFILKVDSNYIG